MKKINMHVQWFILQALCCHIRLEALRIHLVLYLDCHNIVLHMVKLVYTLKGAYYNLFSGNKLLVLLAKQHLEYQAMKGIRSLFKPEYCTVLMKLYISYFYFYFFVI
jgi:hypothetical protein